MFLLSLPYACRHSLSDFSGSCCRVGAISEGTAAGANLVISRSAPPTFNERYRAYASDGLFLTPIALLGVWIVLFVLVLDVWWAVAVFAVIWILYWGSMWSWIGHGQTPGMRRVGLRLVTDAGREPTFRQALVRAAALFVGSVGMVQKSWCW